MRHLLPALVLLVGCPDAAQPGPPAEPVDPVGGEEEAPGLRGHPEVHVGSFQAPDGGDEDTPPDDERPGDDEHPDEDDPATPDPLDEDDEEDSVAPPQVCETLGEGVDPGVVVNEDGWTVQVFADGLGDVTGLAPLPDGSLLLGQGLGAWGAEPVARVWPDGDVEWSPSHPDPDGVAVDSEGAMYVAGAGDVWRLNSLEDGSPDELHAHTGGNNNDVVADGEVLWVAQDGGVVKRVQPDGAVESVFGAGGAAAGDGGDPGTVWVLSRFSGGLWQIDTATLDSTLEAHLGELDPSYITSNRVAYNPGDGAVYASSYFTDAGGQIVRWSPDAPDGVEHWITGLVGDLNPDGLRWHTDGCLYWTAPVGGRVYSVCPCP